MKWSFRIATLAGIQVRIHVTFLLLLGFYAWIYYTDGGPEAAVNGVAFTLLIFLCVLLHEFGHAFAAKRFGIRTPDITLLPIGGVARLERMPENPRQEFVIAIAGPAVNVLIAIVILLLTGGVLPWQGFDLVDSAGGNLLEKLLSVNILLVAFNLIPAFPMDGGRVLRALLATQMPYVAATQTAARVGQVIAALFAISSITSFFGGPLLMFIAFFVFVGAQQELAYARFREAVQGLRVGQAMITRFHALPVSLRAGAIAATLAETAQNVFPFVDDQFHLYGIASREQLRQASRELPPEAPASSIARNPPTVHPGTGFSEALDLLQKSAEPVLPVVNASGQIVGLVGIGQLAELSAPRPSAFCP